MAGNFTDSTLTKKLQLPLQPLQHPLKVQTLDRGPITHCTKPINLYIRAMHQECISLLITVTTKFPEVLGFPAGLDAVA